MILKIANKKEEIQFHLKKHHNKKQARIIFASFFAIKESAAYLKSNKVYFKS